MFQIFLTIVMTAKPRRKFYITWQNICAWAGTLHICHKTQTRTVTDTALHQKFANWNTQKRWNKIGHQKLFYSSAHDKKGIKKNGALPRLIIYQSHDV